MKRRPLKQQMGLLLDDELQERLKEASDATGRSIGAEIRARLAASFEAEDEIDPVTRSFIARIVNWPLLCAPRRISIGTPTLLPTEPLRARLRLPSPGCGLLANQCSDPESCPARGWWTQMMLRPLG